MMAEAEGCLGPGEATMYLDRGMWSTQYIEEGTTTRTVDLKPKLGEARTISFSSGAPPPRCTPVTPPDQTWLVGGHETREPSAHRWRQPGGGQWRSRGGDGRNPRGLRWEGQGGEEQVLWERWWFVDGSTAATVAPEMNATQFSVTFPTSKTKGRRCSR